MKRNKGWLILVGIFTALIVLVYTTTTILTATTKGEDGSMTLGLDLSGGVSITYQIVDENPSQEDIDDTRKKLEERAHSYSTEAAVYQVGLDRITVEIPGVYDAVAVLEDLGSPGSLHFITETNADGEANYSYDDEVGDYALNFDLADLVADGSAMLDGSDVAVVQAGYVEDSTYGNKTPVVHLTFTDEAAKVFAEATTKAAASGQTIGIYYDDHFVSVPSVNVAITDGVCYIEGMEDYAAAEELATFIRIGAINLELTELESNVVGASLGSQALSSSLWAAMCGMILVMLFMIVMYRLPGFASAVSLAIYIAIVIGLIKAYTITLTLPGIAGIILGIGMAVDANVITFARIREELAAGRSVHGAIKEGYSKAFSAILDGNVTTMIAAIVLMLLGSGPVKGFAYTLAISILASMFSCLVVTRFLMEALYAIGFTNNKLYGKAKEIKVIDFIKNRVVYIVISLVLVFAGIGGMAFNKTQIGEIFNYSLEFKGGTSTKVDMGKALTIEEIDADIVPLLEDAIHDNNIQSTTVDGTTQVIFKTKTLQLEERDALNAILVENFGVDEKTIETQSISSTISGEMKTDAILALVVSCFFMLLYIWFRFKDIRFASSAIMALVHDVLIVVTAYALIRISVGNTFIACILTIVGYSINDTIVVFDRIRENMNGIEVRTKTQLKEIANRSLSQTLTRSIYTSITTIIMVVFLYIFGVSSIREFALPLLVGMLAGTYSSIFIATSLWYTLKVRFAKEPLED